MHIGQVLERQPHVLMVYATVDGHTLAISRNVCRRLERQGCTVSLLNVEEALAALGGDRRTSGLREGDVEFDATVIGASIRYGRHSPAVHEFVRRHRYGLLARRPSAFFSVCAVARKPGKDSPETNPYVRRFLRTTGWTPTLAAVFGGRIDYALYGWRDRLVIRFIMWLTQGPTEPQVAVEFTDWARVDQFTDTLAARLGLVPPGLPLVHLRPAVATDAAACITLRGQTRDNAMDAAALAARGITPDSWAASMARGEVRGWVAEVPADPGAAASAAMPRLLGFAAAALADGEVLVLAVHADAEGQGLGRRLLAKVVADLHAAGHQRLYLHTVADPSWRAHGFYRHLGWRPTGQLDEHGDERLEWPIVSSADHGDPAADA